MQIKNANQKIQIEKFRPRKYFFKPAPTSRLQNIPAGSSAKRRRPPFTAPSPDEFPLRALP
ncbi:MAG: hypothetical protein K2N94_17170, partial [Lachnospiraceae bacterium]|nr:hypothetical protein [Lachnospiraceae bacterium]